MNLLLFIVLQYLLLNYYISLNLFLIAVAISGSLLIFQLTQLTIINGRHFKELGSQSMVIYILHILVASGIRIVLQHIFGVDDIKLHLTLGTLLGIYVPFVIYKLGILEKGIFLFKLPLKG